MDLVISHRGVEVERFVVLPTGPVTPTVIAVMERACSERTGVPREELTSTLEVAVPAARAETLGREIEALILERLQTRQ